MNNFSLERLLPMLPWEGPPLPRFLGLFWPWRTQVNSVAGPAAADVLYQNSEELEIVRDDSGAISKIVRHIRVTKNA